MCLCVYMCMYTSYKHVNQFISSIEQSFVLCFQMSCMLAWRMSTYQPDTWIEALEGDEMGKQTNKNKKGGVGVYQILDFHLSKLPFISCQVRDTVLCPTIRVSDPAAIVSAATEVSSCSTFQCTGNISKNKSSDHFMWIIRVYSHRIIHLLSPCRCVKLIK